MKIIVQDVFDKPITKEDIDAAIKRGKDRSWLRATRVNFLQKKEKIELVFGKTKIGIDVKSIPEFADIPKEDMQGIELILGGKGLCIEKHDLHIKVESLIPGWAKIIIGSGAL